MVNNLSYCRLSVIKTAYSINICKIVCYVIACALFAFHILPYLLHYWSLPYTYLENLNNTTDMAEL